MQHIIMQHYYSTLKNHTHAAPRSWPLDWPAVPGAAIGPFGARVMVLVE